MTPQEKYPCPSCGSLDTLEVVYGEPEPDLFEAADRGEIALGGCALSGDDPDRRCKACGTEFKRTRTRKSRDK